jgi:NADPH:quinone reductase-like Zn-dependent oxidoreductase
MKAAQVTQYGGPEVMAVNEVPAPTAEAGKILIEVHAASLNPFDSKARDGAMKDSVPLPLPATFGGDFAGVVSAVGTGVDGVTVGEEVYGQASPYKSGSGSFAEFAATTPDQLSAKPQSLDFVKAAAMPLVGVSAVQALIEHMNLQPGQKILIHGGAGGIGSIAIQIAKHIGAFVATTVATEEIDFAKQLGADQVIDYKTQNFEDEVHDCDAVYDTVAGDTYTRSFQVLKPGGVIVSMLEQPNQELMEQYKVTAIAQQTTITPEKLTKLAELIDQGVVTPQVDKVFPLDKITEAFIYRETGHPRGKVVLQIKE